MKLRISWLALALLAGCDRGDSAAPPPANSNITAKPPVTKPKASTETAMCAPPPALELPKDFAPPTKAFTPGGDGFGALKSRFAKAYEQACATGLLKNHPLIDPSAPHAGRLLLKNAPNANIASIYRDSEDGWGDVVLEYSFVTSNGATHVPNQEELSEAIYCAVHGATKQEEQESGRCLAD